MRTALRGSTKAQALWFTSDLLSRYVDVKGSGFADVPWRAALASELRRLAASLGSQAARLEWKAERMREPQPSRSRRSGLRSRPLRTVGARAKSKEDAIYRFKAETLANAGGRCERCTRAPDTEFYIAAHHIVPRSIGVGWDLLHDADANGAALCSERNRGRNGCHELVHDHQVADWAGWIQPRPAEAGA